MGVNTTCGHPGEPGKVRRGLCVACYFRARRAGTLDNHERKTYRGVDIAAEVEYADITFHNCERLGLKPMGLLRGLERAHRTDLIARLGGEQEARRVTRGEAG